MHDRLSIQDVQSTYILNEFWANTMKQHNITDVNTMHDYLDQELYELTFNQFVTLLLQGSL